MKTKTYVLMVSTQFPAYHKRKGEETYFPEKIMNGIQKEVNELDIDTVDKKIHTIRTNYAWWEKRINNIQAGKAELSIRYWLLPGGCYTKGNKQIEICRLDKDSGIGIQKVEYNRWTYFTIDGISGDYTFEQLAKNDGLSVDDFTEWFLNCPDELMAVIHFTKFRY